MADTRYQMALAVLLLVAAAAEAAPATAGDQGPYSSKYDGVDLDKVLASDRLLNSYFQCLMDNTEERCTADAKYLKEVIPDALTNECSRCRQNQKEGAEKVIRFLINNKPDMWEKLEAKYDPQGLYQKRYQKELERVKGGQDQEPYSSKYDNVNLDEVLASERLLNSYFECLMADTTERCTADAKYLKEVIPDALTNGCSRCRPNQREGADKVIKHLMKNKPDMWNKLEAKYDPEGVYKKKYQKEYEMAKSGDEPYSSKYDNVNLDEVLASERLLNSYFECLMAETEERCTADAKYLKEVIPDALTNGCSRCRPNQREGADKVIKHLMKNKPDMWKQLEAKYDPDGTYRKKYQNEYNMAKSGEEPYSSKYDNVNLDEVLASERLLNSYFQCLMADTEERCTADAKYLKEVIPDALTNGCARCRPNQREGADKVITFLAKNKPDMWNKLEAKYDPQGVYRSKYQKEYQRVKQGQGLSERAQGAQDNEPYSTKYDNVNLDEVLASERLLNSYFQCLMDNTEERCTADAKYLKEVVPDALNNGCSRCRPNQREGAEKVIKHLMKNKPDMWKQLEAKYDPDGTYRKKYQNEYNMAKSGEEPYSTKYDNVNLDEVLASERLLNSYFECLMADTEERCTADAKYLKEVVPDALNNGCSRCRPNQREGAEKVIKHLMKNKPDMWKQLEAKYDPDGTYRKKYQNEYNMAKSGEEPYSSKYDNVNLDEVLASERLLNSYFQCLMADTEERCTADAKYLKEVIPDALTNGCARCRPNQREGADKVITFLVKNKPDMWNKLEAKYDPQGVYRSKYQKDYQRVKQGQGLSERAQGAQDNEPYSTKYDNVNLDEVLASERLLNSYFECLMDNTEERCTADAKYLKEVVPDALKTGCSRCRPNQREGAEKVIRHLVNNKPDMWRQLEAKYDPEGVYQKKYHSDYERVKGQQDADMYSSKYDGVNLDEVLRSDRLLDSYFRCLIENTEEHCTADAKYLKEVVPDALTNGCSRCRPNQREGAEKVIRFLIKNKPAMWNQLEAKYDPEGIYKSKYQNDYQRIKA